MKNRLLIPVLACVACGAAVAAEPKNPIVSPYIVDVEVQFVAFARADIDAIFK